MLLLNKLCKTNKSIYCIFINQQLPPTFCIILVHHKIILKHITLPSDYNISTYKFVYLEFLQLRGKKADIYGPFRISNSDLKVEKRRKR